MEILESKMDQLEIISNFSHVKLLSYYIHTFKALTMYVAERNHK